MKFRTALLPFEGVAQEHLDNLVADLAAHAIEAKALPRVSLPKDAYDPARDQYAAESFLYHSRRLVPSGRVLGVTDIDLYAGTLDFVFGLAEMQGRIAVISLHRLHAGGNETIFRGRAIKEAVHELGHTFGLDHCPDRRCVMHFSNSLADTDLKASRLCARCETRLQSLA